MISLHLPAWLLIICDLCLAQSSPLANSTTASNASTRDATTSSFSRSAPRGRSFSFIIPYNETQSCDIYGPICQTGSIAVRLSSSPGTSTTTIPCSSYLSAQSTYLKSFNPLEGQIFADRWPIDWQIGFGRSPECSSYGEVWRSQGMYTFSGCGTNDAVVPASRGIFLPSQIPPAVLRKRTFQTFECCGNCSLSHIPEVRLYYFPDPTASEYCKARNASTVGGNFTTATIDKRVPSDLGGPVTTVLSGHTFTSPSLYLELPGTIGVKDQCGSFGPALTNPFVAIPPGQLSTYIPPVELLKSGPHGIEYKDLNGLHGAFFLGTVKPLNVAELACPTFGLGIGTSANGDTYTTIGPPYLPIIVPPPQVLSAVPEWQVQCKGFLSYAPGLSSFAIFDPPRTLTPVAELGPKPSATPVYISASPTPPLQSASVPPIVPAQSLVLDSPRPTKASDPAVPVTHPGNAGTSSANQDAAQNPSGNVPIHGNSDPAVEQQDNAQGLGELIIGALNGGPIGKPIVSYKDKPSATDIMPNGGEAQAVNFPGEQIGGDEGHLSPSPGHSPESPTSIFKVADQTFTANPTGFPVGGVKIVPGRVAVTIGGTPVALRTDGNLLLGTSTIPLELTPSPASSVYTVGNQPFTPNPTGFPVGAVKIVPGQVAVTIGGTPVALRTDGNLVLGTSTIQLELTPSPASSVYTVGNQPFTANPTGFSIGGIKVTPGQEPVTIAGTPVALRTDGVLIMGTSTIPLQAAPKPSPSIFTVGNEHFTAHPTGFLVAGTSILPDGRPVTIAGTQVLLDPSGVLVIGSSSITLSPKATPTRDVNTINGQLVTANPINAVTSGIDLKPGAAAVTASGTPISLSPSHVLYIGDSAITIAPDQFDSSSIITYQGMKFTPLPSGTVVVAGTTLTPGGSAVVIAGTDATLGLGGDEADALQTAADAAGDASGNNTAIVSAFTGGQPSGLIHGFSLWVGILLLLTVLNMLW